jgi:hypothetical protein
VSVDSVLDDAFTTLLAKARSLQDQLPRAAIKPAMAHFQWTGGGQPIAVAVDPLTFASTPTSCDPVLIEVPFPCTIQWAHLWAGDGDGNPVAVTATIEIFITTILTFGAAVPLKGTGTPPTLTLDSATDCDLTGWFINLVTGDALVARVETFTGLASWLALTLLLRPVSEEQGVAGIVDENGDLIVDENGNVIVLRN